MGKLPAILLYDGDWVKDGVAGCSLGAQGLWLRMCFIGHNSERYGYLQVNGRPIPQESIARRCGCTLVEYETYLSELDRNGVPSRTPDEIIFSRRLVSDAKERAIATARKRKSRSSHDSVTPLSVNEDVRGSEVVLAVALRPEGFVPPVWVPEKAWLAFMQMRHVMKKPATDEAKARLVIKLEKLMNEGHNPEAVLWESVTNGWAGLFPLKKDTVTAVKVEPLKWKAKE